jgi:aminocarboxymuconate-semialdehyde decarboxylase
MIIDVHAHALHEAFLAEMATRPDQGMDVEIDSDGQYRSPIYGQLDPLLYKLESRLDDLTKRGIDHQLITPLPSLLSNPRRAADVNFSRQLNHFTALTVGESAGRLGGMAALALAEPNLAPEELRRAIGSYGFKGVVLPTTVKDRPLDGPEFEPIFAALESLELLVFMHPTSSVLRESLGAFSLNTLIGFPHETTLAVSRLIFSGVLERHPGLKIVLSHGGGTLPFLRGRLNLGYSASGYEANAECRAHIRMPPGDYLNNLFFDTCVGSQESLLFLINLIGSEHIMFGSDFPYDIGDADGSVALGALANVAETTQNQILWHNASRALSIRH